MFVIGRGIAMNLGVLGQKSRTPLAPPPAAGSRGRAPLWLWRLRRRQCACGLYRNTRIKIRNKQISVYYCQFVGHWKIYLRPRGYAAISPIWLCLWSSPYHEPATVMSENMRVNYLFPSHRHSRPYA